MLVLENIAPEVRPEVSIDRYVALSLKVPGARAPEGYVYWQTVPCARTLVEVWLCAKTGRLCSVTVAGVDPLNVRVVESKPLLSVSDVQHGTPCFSLRGWSLNERDYASRMLDVNVPITLEVGAGTCGVVFDETQEPCRAVVFGTATCLFAHDAALVRLDVESLTQAEEDTIKDGLLGDAHRTNSQR